MSKNFVFNDEQISNYSELSNSDWIKVRHLLVCSPPYDEFERTKILKDTFNVLNSINAKFWLTGGSLLGAIRDKQFIAWDDDIDITMMVEEFHSVMFDLKKKLIANGFIVRLTNSKKFPKVSFFKNGFKVSIGALLKRGKWRIRSLTRCPAYLFESEEFIYFKDMKFRVPSPVNDYLTHVYGDWNTVNKSSKYNEYINPNYFRSNLLYKQKIQLIKLIKKILKK